MITPHSDQPAYRYGHPLMAYPRGCSLCAGRSGFATVIWVIRRRGCWSHRNRSSTVTWKTGNWYLKQMFSTRGKKPPAAQLSYLFIFTRACLWLIYVLRFSLPGLNSFFFHSKRSGNLKKLDLHIITEFYMYSNIKNQNTLQDQMVIFKLPVQHINFFQL